jgi:hypothetical protein
MHTGLHVKYPLLLSDFNETLISLTDFEKYSDIKFHENPSSGSRFVPCGRMDRHAEAIVALRNFANAPKIYILPTQGVYVFCVDLRTNSEYFPIQH